MSSALSGGKKGKKKEDDLPTLKTKLADEKKRTKVLKEALLKERKTFQDQEEKLESVSRRYSELQEEFD